MRVLFGLLLGAYIFTACSPVTVTLPDFEPPTAGPACLGAYLQDHQNPRGAKIVSLQSGGPLYLARVREGDVIVAINGVPTPFVSSVRYELSRYVPGDVVVVRHARERLYGLYWDYYESPTRLGQQRPDGTCVVR